MGVVSISRLQLSQGHRRAGPRSFISRIRPAIRKSQFGGQMLSLERFQAFGNISLYMAFSSPILTVWTCMRVRCTGTMSDVWMLSASQHGVFGNRDYYGISR